MSGQPKIQAKHVLSSPDVKIAVLSDIHANLHALQEVIHNAEQRGVDFFVNAGDLVGYGAFPNEVVELSGEKNLLSVVGNYDLEVIGDKSKDKGEKKIALKFARKELSKLTECYLYSLPRELRLEAAERKLYVTHGSPESIDEHIYPDTSVEHLKTLAQCAKADILVVGHSHEQFWKQVNGASFVNPGSVGRPGDGNPQTGYAILTFNPDNVELIRLDYDVASAADALRKKGLPESFAQMLLRGVSLDTIAKEDEAKQNEMEMHCQENVETAKKVAKKYWPDTEHYSQVTRIALQFFDKLAVIHKLGQHERCWLECAATLHDIGLSQSRGGHHKQSLKLILNDPDLAFSSEDRRAIASIARYHRKGLPKKSHYNLLSFDRETKNKVKVLASFLRVADGLDYTHESIVKNLNFKIAGNKITIECIGEESLLEGQAFNKKKDLFEKVFARKLMLVWKQQ
jgi:putative phosphoesterase